MNKKVVPEPSALRTTVIFCAGRLRSGFKAAIDASFQVLIFPKKIFASVLPSNLSAPGATPSRFTTGTTPPMIAGNCIMPNSLSSAGLRGASEAPKSTVLALICLTPAPEPID